MPTRPTPTTTTATMSTGHNSSLVHTDVTTDNVIAHNASVTTTARDDAVTVSLGEEMSSLFSGLTKAEEVIIFAVIVVGVLAVLAILLRVAMPILRMKRAPKAASPGDSGTWSTAGSVGPDSVKDSEKSVDSWTHTTHADYPALFRLEPLNLQYVYVENWKKTSITSLPSLHR